MKVYRPGRLGRAIRPSRLGSLWNSQIKPGNVWIVANGYPICTRAVYLYGLIKSPTMPASMADRKKSKCQKYDECKLVFGTALYSVIKPTYIPEPSHRPGEKELLYLSYARISIKTMARKST